VPTLGVNVDHVLDLVVDAGGVRQELIEMKRPTTFRTVVWLI